LARWPRHRIGLWIPPWCGIRRVSVAGAWGAASTGKPRRSVLGSSETALHGRQRIALEASRVQIEWLGRDSTPFTGRLDCQARVESALAFPVNAALATRHLVRAEDLGLPPGQESPGCSRASWKPRQFHERGRDLCLEK
jgi:hypothetical protein